MNSLRIKGWLNGIVSAFLLILLIAVSGCGSSGTGSSLSTEQQYQQKVYIIGTIADPPTSVTEDISAVKGPVDAVKQVFVNRVAYDGVSSDAPIFMAADQVSSLSDTIKQGILTTYRNSQPIILIRGNETQINALRGILGRDRNFKLPDNFPYVEMYALSTELAGNFSLAVYPPGSSDPAYRPDSSAAVSADNSDNMLQRAGVLHGWIDERGSSTASQELADFKANARKELAETSKSDITDLVKAEVDSVFFVDPAYGSNGYTLKHSMYPVHQFNADSKGKEYDWLYVEQKADLAGKPRYEKYGKIRSLSETEKLELVKIKPIYYALGANDIDVVHYISRYAISNYLENLLSSQVSVQDSSPQTVNHQTKTSSGLKLDLSGEFGFAAKKESEGSATVKGGLSFSKETEIIMDDCEIINNTASSSSSDATWTYNFQLPTQYSWWGAFAKLNPPVNLSINTFQPTNKWIWRFDPTVRDSAERFMTHFEADNKITYSTFSVFWIPVDPPTHLTEFVFSVLNQTALYFAPVIVAPSKNLILASSSAQYTTMDVSVGRAWNAVSDQDWCRVAPITGKADNPKFSITVDENTLGKERKATITFRTNDYGGTDSDKKYKQDVMTVTQPPKL